jgi:hypothetical protein
MPEPGSEQKQARTNKNLAGGVLRQKTRQEKKPNFERSNGNLEKTLIRAKQKMMTR